MRLTALLPVLVALALAQLPGVAAAGHRIAVLDFTAASDDPTLAPLGKGLRSMITTDLAQVAAIEVVERARIQEVLGELELQASAAVDPATAARVGRLAGATHLLAGSFTVLDQRMRLDAQLTSVQSGKVVIAEQIDGERDAFFELEQTLTSKLIAALELKPEPKERAALRRIHTADWQAFADYSAGLDLFDREAYEESLTRLRAAGERDEDFKLARTTLAEYERLVAELRARSDALRVTKAELRRLEKDQAAQGDAELLARLWGVAGEEGPEAADLRAAALYSLAVAYSNTGRNRGKLMELRKREDRFAMERTADALVDRYMLEAAPRWPELPLVATERFYRGLPDPERFDEDLAETGKRMREKGLDYPDNRRQYLIDDLRYPQEYARRLHLDRAEEVGLAERFLDAAMKLSPEPYWIEDIEEKLIKEYRAVLRLDDSTALLRAHADRSDNEYALKGLADQIEINAGYQRLLEEARNVPLMREWLLLGQAKGWSKGPVLRFGREHFLGARPDAEGLAQLGRFRELKTDEYLLVADRPMWVLQAPWRLRSGPRVDPLRAASVRYYDDGERDDLEPLAVWGAAPTDRVQVSFRLDYEPADDFWPRGVRPDADAPAATAKIVGTRPTAGFFFGARDLDVDKRKHPDTGESELHRPTRMHAVLFEADAVVLVSGVEAERGSYGRKERWEWTELGRAPRKGGKSRSEVEVGVEGTKVRVRVDGKEHRFQAPGLESGFTGFLWRGTGYVEVSKLRTR